MQFWQCEAISKIAQTRTSLVKSKIIKMAWNIRMLSLKFPSLLASLSLLAILALLVHSASCDKIKDIDVKDIAEEWFTNQAVGSLGKKFLEKVKCSKFVSHFHQVQQRSSVFSG